jgi:tetratricopeptide (TPR) repeat protein
MKKAGILILMVLFPCALVFSQVWTGQGRQIGYVYDEEGNPLEGVKVKLFYVKGQSGFELNTDKDGKWVAIGVKGGTWDIDFEKPGYMTKKITWNILDFRQVNQPIEIKLKKAEGLVISEQLKEDFKKGGMLYEEGKYEEAIEIFTAILEAFPNAYIINLNIGNCYFQMENYDEAEKFYKVVIENDPQNHMALMGIGNCYTNRGENEKALEWYNKIEFEKIDDATVLFNIGTIFKNNSRHEDALKYYKRAVEIQEDFLDGIYQLGLAYLTLGKNAEALNEFENYLKHDPDSDRASQVKGFIEYLKKKTNEGKESNRFLLGRLSSWRTSI